MPQQVKLRSTPNKYAEWHPITCTP
jgi:hypothetical protein